MTCQTASCCRVESLVSIDERGQMVLPKELRDRAGIKAGDKLAVISWEKDGAICCLSLLKAEQLAEGGAGYSGHCHAGAGNESVKVKSNKTN